MTQPFNRQRRQLLLDATTMLGATALLSISPWGRAVTAGIKAGDRKTGVVTVVVFDRQGRRQGPRQVRLVQLSEHQWRQRLTAAEFRILRGNGTEPAFSGRYVNPPKVTGFYRCRGCDNALFDAATQFHSGTGWPSFYQPIAASNVVEAIDTSYGMQRTEVHCARCGGHLGHKFHDGPAPTGLRYCIDSLALRFITTDKQPEPL